MLEQALAAHRQGRYEDAEKQYQDLLATDPDHYEALHCYALLKQDLGQLDEAQGMVEKAIELRPQAAAYFATLGAIRHAQGDLPAARSALQQALERNPNLLQGHNTLGYLQLQCGELAAAETSLETALRLEPESAQAMTNLGNVLLAQGRQDEAMTMWQRALSIDPGSLAARASLAEGLLQQGAFATAEQAFRRVLEERPASANLYAGLARALLAQGQTAEARWTAIEALGYDRQNFAALKVAGEATLAAGLASEAVNLLQQALLVRRGDPATVALLAAALEARGDLAQARRSLEAIASSWPGADASLLALRARMGEREVALAGLRQLLDEEPGRADVALILADLIEQPAAALALLDALPASAAKHDSVLLRRAELLLATDQAAAVLPTLESISASSLSDRMAASARELRARALDALGRYGEAAEGFRDVVTELRPKEIRLREPAVGLQPLAVPDDSRSPPVLLTGMPGSGLGWLAAMLNDLAAFEVLTDRIDHPDERRDLFSSDAEQRRGERPPDTHQRLERRAYWNAAARLRRKHTGRVLLLDVIPASQFDANIVAHYFPGATIVVAVRHPGDLLLHARTLGWRAGLVRANAIEEFYAPLLQPPSGLTVRWLDADALREGDTSVLAALARQFDLTAEDLPAALERHVGHWGDGRWPAGHWRHYHQNLALLGPQMTRLAADLGYPE